MFTKANHQTGSSLITLITAHRTRGGRTVYRYTAVCPRCRDAWLAHKPGRVLRLLPAAAGQRCAFCGGRGDMSPPRPLIFSRWRTVTLPTTAGAELCLGAIWQYSARYERCPTGRWRLQPPAWALHASWRPTWRALGTDT